MKYRYLYLFVPLLATFVGGVFLLLVLHTRSITQHVSLPASSDEGPQCAHWAIFRTAQLLGIPTTPDEIQKLLPNQPKGHSIPQIVATLSQIGIQTEAYRNDWDSLSKKSFPCIVHLKEPEHYIVVSGIEPERGYVHIFDDAGNRTRQDRKIFELRWAGYTLHVKKNKNFFEPKQNESSPRAMYDHLILDKGDIPAIGEPTEFVFPIKNIGRSDLVIEDIKVNCSCLKSEIPKQPIHHNESGVIKLFYSVESKRGAFAQTAAVKTNDPKNPVVVLSACGYTGVEVQLVPSKINLDRLFVGHRILTHCIVSYSGEWNDCNIELASADLDGLKLLRSECVPINADISKVAPGLYLKPILENKSVAILNKRWLLLEFEPSDDLPKQVRGSVNLKTNVSGYEHIKLEVLGEIKSSVTAFPSTVEIKNDIESQVTLVSMTDESFSIVGIDCDSSIFCRYDSSALQKEHTVNIKKTGNPQSSQITIKYKFDNNPTPHNLPITLINNNVK
jgi:predicted double-glycine peptidase